MAEKFGGDVFQSNSAGQFNMTGQKIEGVSDAGAAMLDSFAGSSVLNQGGKQFVDQDMHQSNSGAAGDGGSDNVHADKKLFFF